MNQEFDKYHDAYNDMLEIVRNKYIIARYVFFCVSKPGRNRQNSGQRVYFRT